VRLEKIQALFHARPRYTDGGFFGARMNVLILSPRAEKIAAAVKAVGATPFHDGHWAADIDLVLNDGQEVAQSIRERLRVIDL